MTDFIRDQNHVPVSGGVSSTDATVTLPFKINPLTGRLLVDTAGGAGTVTTVSVASANGFAGTVATATTTPVITLTTSITGILKGNGTAISAATDGSDYLSSTTGVTIAQGAAQTVGTTTNRVLKIWATDLTVTNAITGSVTGNAATVTTNANLTGVITSVGNATSIASQTGTGTKFVVDNTPTLLTPVFTGLPTGTGVSSTAAISTLASRDASGILAAVNWNNGYSTTATAAASTTLTVGSNFIQYFTGATTQTVVLPVASTLTLGFQYMIVNLSSGLVTVNSSGGNAVIILAAGTSVIITCILTSGTTAASWNYIYSGDAIATGKKFTLSNSLTLAGTDGTTMTFPTTSATIARTDAANTFTGASTASAWVLTSPTITTKISPTADDGAPLGDTTHNFSDLFLATGAVINYANGNVAMTHTSGILTIGTGTLKITTPTNTTTSVMTIDGTQTVTNKRQQPRITSAASYTTNTGTSLDVSTTDIFVITAQAGALLFNNPSGTPVQGEKLLIRIKDNGTARALTYDTQFRASSDLALPTTTVLSKTLYMGFIYNATDTKWDLLAVLNNI